jgi:hypothetical protein
MALVARTRIKFNGEVLEPGDKIKQGFADKAQVEEWVSIGSVVDERDMPAPNEFAPQAGSVEEKREAIGHDQVSDVNDGTDVTATGEPRALDGDTAVKNQADPEAAARGEDEKPQKSTGK